jgi:hypothetical protein
MHYNAVIYKQQHFFCKLLKFSYCILQTYYITFVQWIFENI